MQATLRLNIVNKETMKVLNRILPNKDNYFERVCVKIGLLIKDSILGNAYALVTLYQLHDEILNLSSYFDDEIDKFEGQIEKKKKLDLNKVNFIAKHECYLPYSNVLSYALSELMEGFDKLVSTLKLVDLSGLLESKSAFYQLKMRFQKKLNLLLSKIIQIPSSKRYSRNILDIINANELPDESLIDINTLIKAIDAPYAPGFSHELLSNLKFKLKSLITMSDKKYMESSK